MEKIYLISSNYFFNNKSIKNIFFGILFLFAFIGNSSAQTYCAAAATSTADDEIFNVTFSTLNNTTNCSSLGGAGSILNRYNNYTSTVAAPILFLGNNYPLSIKVGQCGTSAWSGIAGAWIDYNQNGVFTDPGENIYMSPYTSFAVAGTIVSPAAGVTIPLTATPGTTRMRIIATESSTAPGPCTNPTWGEVEDYNVTIISPSPIDLTVTNLLKPLSTKNCFGTDTIIARVQNYGSAVMNFSATPAILTVSVTGAATNTYTLAINTGTLGVFATRDYTVTTNYNMATVGTFNFKAYTSVSGDGSASNDTITKSVNKIITPTPNLGNDSLYCNLPVIINSNTTANSYLWNNASIGSNLNVTAPGKYWVRATNSNGCVGSDTILISLGNSPIVTLGPDTGYCQGSTINLYAGIASGNSYLWSTGATTSSITVGTAGTYSVIVTNTVGCKSSDTINVISKSKPLVTLSFNNGPTSFCPTDLTGRPLTEGSPAGGTYIGAGVTSNSFFPNQATQGTHIIIYSYTDPNGCSNTAKDTLTVNACVGVEELTDNIGLNVYPNPNSGTFTLELITSTDFNGKIQIMSIDGKLIYNDIIAGNGLITKSINISDLAEGIYYLKLETETAIKTFKILKQ